MNFYCRLLAIHPGYADYAVGSSPKNLDGIVRFYSAQQAPLVITPSEGFAFRRGRIYSIDRKYRAQFECGVFPERMSWEIG